MTPTERRRRARMLSIRDARRRARRRTVVILVDGPPVSGFFAFPGCPGHDQRVQFRFRRMVPA